MTFQEKYKKEILPEMMNKFGYKNKLAVPRLQKIVINTGIGRYREDEPKKEIKKYLEAISGQKVVERGAKKSIASFKTRDGMIIGYSATLRGQRMYNFLEKTIMFAIPRERDFRGLRETSVDQGGNLTIGIKESTIYPEMIDENIKNVFGFEVTFVTNAKSREEALGLFKLIGVPFAKK